MKRQSFIKSAKRAYRVAICVPQVAEVVDSGAVGKVAEEPIE